MKQKFNFLAALFAATVIALFAGCKAESDPVIDTTPPAKVMLAENAAAPGNNFVRLSWTNPADDDFYAVKISFEPKAADVAQPFLVPGAKGQGASYLVTGLTNGTKYTFSLVSLDKTLNESEAVTAECTPVYVDDTTAPADITSLNTEEKSEAVVLTWTDPTDTDLFGIEIAWEESAPTAAASLRAITQMEKNTLFVAPGEQTAEISGLKPETEYTFTVKAMDKSGNKSKGETISAKTLAFVKGETMEIALSSQSELSNKPITVTVKITTGGTVEKVVYKKDGSISARELFADEEATAAVQSEGDNSVWTFDVTENGTYTVAALDSDGRRETEQHTVNELDFVAPEVKNLKDVYNESEKTITLTWEIPGPVNEYDSPYDCVLISYTHTTGETTTAPVTETIADGTTTYKLENVSLSENEKYTFTVKVKDKLGTVSNGVERVVNNNMIEVVKVMDSDVTVTGADHPDVPSNANDAYKGVFIKNRTVTLSPFYIGKHEVTQEEYEEVMTTRTVTVGGTEHTLNATPSYCKEGSSYYQVNFGTEQGKRPVEGVTWYDAVYYCNLLSEKYNLTPAYNITVTKVNSNGNITNADVTLVDGADGWRLPTEAEWEFAARGGNPEAEAWKYLFSGAPTASGVAYNASQNSGLDAVGWYRYNNDTGTTSESNVTNSASGRGTHQVGQKAANALGLYDMSGNVVEWCWDWYGDISTGTVSDPTGPSSRFSRVLRGGSWGYSAVSASVCERSGSDPSYSDYYHGFRLVRSAQ